MSTTLRSLHHILWGGWCCCALWANVGRSFLKGSGLRKAFRVGDDCSGRAPVTQVCLRVSALIPLWMFYLWCLCFSCCFLHGSMAISSLQSHKVSVYFLCFLYCFSCCSGARQLLPLHFCLASYCFVLLLHFSLFITFLLSLLLFCFSYCISAFPPIVLLFLLYFSFCITILPQTVFCRGCSVPLLKSLIVFGPALLKSPAQPAADQKTRAIPLLGRRTVEA